MIQLNFDGKRGGTLKILCLGAHSDDIEIGCGGTILRLRQQYPDCEVHWVVFSANGVRGEEARRGAESFVARHQLKALGLKTFPDSFMPFVGTEVKATFEEMKKAVNPDVVLTHHGNDAHQDHRLLAELTWNTFRDNLILEYEIPKYDGDMGRPNVFVPLEADAAQQKVRIIMETFQSQRSKNWFEERTFLSLMRLRGMECNSPSGYAEAFYCRKLVL